jgi:MFS superfamily sulfate permease-like transporter
VDKPKTLATDLSAGLVVFLVALPLCLGIASASDVPPVYGIIAGAIGGIVTGFISKSPLSVSGPAAGLVAVVSTAISQLNGNIAAFQLALVLAGLMQLAFGFLKAGAIASFIPNSVIKGMLAGIGVVIILKQIPHACGWDRDYEGDFGFLSKFGNTFVDIGKALSTLKPSAVLVFLLGAFVIMLWESKLLKSKSFTKLIPGPLVAVVVGSGLNSIFGSRLPAFYLRNEDQHLVHLPSFQEMVNSFRLPDFTAISNQVVWMTAATVAVVASVETLLSIDAADKLDPQHRATPPNRELIAQGVGNSLCGLLGGLPVTSVVVRTSANAYAGAKSKISTIFHGFLLVVCAIFLTQILNTIPLAVLASILILIGWKLTKPSVIKAMYAQGQDQFLPFICTLMGVVFLDLLKGVAFGLVIGLFYIIRANHHRSFTIVNDENNYLLRFNKDITFTSKASLTKILSEIPDNSKLIVSGVKADYIDSDIFDILNDFTTSSKERGIEVELLQIEGKSWTSRMKTLKPS